jgi:hypothetical protein
MQIHWIGPDVVAPVMVFAIPIVAVGGGILAGIVKTVSAHRLMEAAVRERMALIARGVDPARIPAVPLDAGLAGFGAWPLVEYARFRAQGLLIGGFVTLAGGLALGAFIGMMDGWDEGSWTFGLIPVAIGIALLLSALLVWPRGRETSPMTAPRVG